MHSTTSTGKVFKGSVSVVVSNERLQLVFRYGGKQNYISLGLSDSEENRKFAESRARQIELDILAGNIDTSWSKYKAQSLAPKLEIASEQSLSLLDLFTRYIDFKVATNEKNTVRLYGVAKRKLESYGKIIQNWNDAQSLIVWMRAKGTGDNTIHKYLLDYKAAVVWGLERGLWTKPNPFRDCDKSLERKKPGEDRRPFTREEMNLIIEAFSKDRYYKYYTNSVRFKFLTGCRTAETIGLQWKHISLNFSTINFCESVVEVEGELIRKPTKTGEARLFRCNQTLKTFLKEIKPTDAGPDDLVFPAKKGGYIDAHNFAARAWLRVLESLNMTAENNLYRPPYCTRRTFITLCLENGIDAKDVASCVGNSPEMIYKHYAGGNRNLQVPEF